jgi:FimV-like protein
MRYRLLAAALACLFMSLAPPGALAQARAPKGGTYVNGRFYKGGQFIPGGGGSYSAPVADAGPAPEAPRPRGYVHPDVRRKARLAARTSARSGYRSSAKSEPSPESTADDPEQLARARLKLARNLIAMGKAADARAWLDKVVNMNASRATVEEAKDLLAGLVGPRRSGSAAVRAPGP